MVKKIAVITGGSSGIGNAIANKLLTTGYTVINADINAPEIDSEAGFVYCDITDPSQISMLYQYVKSHHGIPDVLISNAGQGIHEKLTEGDPEKWQTVMDINFMGAMRFVRAFVPEMMEKKEGDIFFISSIASAQPYTYGGIYTASKAALNIAAKTLQMEVADALRVCILYPGVVDTPFFENMVGSNHTVEDIGVGSIPPEQLANFISYALLLPKDIHIPEIKILPGKQYG